MRSRIIGGLAAVSGAVVLIGGLMRGGPTGSGAYGAGQTAGLVLGGLLLVVGLYYVLRRGG